MSTPDRSPHARPYLSTVFRVLLNQVDVGGFSEVTGLEASMEPLEYQEGGVNHFTHRLPTRVGHGNVTLKRGITESHELWGWFDGMRSGSTIRRRNVQIYLLDRTERPETRLRGWGLTRAFPVRWSGPEFVADTGAVAIEQVELTHEGLETLAVVDGENEGQQNG